jgi:hypothetical protein
MQLILALDDQAGVLADWREELRRLGVTFPDRPLAKRNLGRRAPRPMT